MGAATELNQRIVLDCLIMRAVPRELAFEQDEAVDGEGRGCKAAVSLDEDIRGPARPPFPARQGDVRMEGAPLGLEADRLADGLDLSGQWHKPRLRLHFRP